jgi:hypothetical protein
LTKIRRVTIQHDPRGITNTLTYSYDQLDRLTQQSATNLGTIDAQYDALGRRPTISKPLAQRPRASILRRTTEDERRTTNDRMCYLRPSSFVLRHSND